MFLIWLKNFDNFSGGSGRAREVQNPPTTHTYVFVFVMFFFFNYSTCQVIKFLELQNHIFLFEILFSLIKHFLDGSDHGFVK